MLPPQGPSSAALPSGNSVCAQPARPALFGNRRSCGCAGCLRARRLGRFGLPPHAVSLLRQGPLRGARRGFASAVSRVVCRCLSAASAAALLALWAGACRGSCAISAKPAKMLARKARHFAGAGDARGSSRRRHGASPAASLLRCSVVFAFRASCAVR